MSKQYIIKKKHCPEYICISSRAPGYSFGTNKLAACCFYSKAAAKTEIEKRNLELHLGSKLVITRFLI